MNESFKMCQALRQQKKKRPIVYSLRRKSQKFNCHSLSYPPHKNQGDFPFLLFSLNNSLNGQCFRNDLSALSLKCAFLSSQKQQWIFFPSPKLTRLTSCPFLQLSSSSPLLPRDFSHNILDEGCCPVSLYDPFIIALVYSVF